MKIHRKSIFLVKFSVYNMVQLIFKKKKTLTHFLMGLLFKKFYCQYLLIISKLFSHKPLMINIIFILLHAPILAHQCVFTRKNSIDLCKVRLKTLQKKSGVATFSPEIPLHNPKSVRWDGELYLKIQIYMYVYLWIF